MLLRQCSLFHCGGLKALPERGEGLQEAGGTTWFLFSIRWGPVSPTSVRGHVLIHHHPFQEGRTVLGACLPLGYGLVEIRSETSDFIAQKQSQKQEKPP